MQKEVWYRTCFNQAVRFLEICYDNDNFVGTVLIDLSKAFDCIPHGILITKMIAYGLGNKACEFMASYQHERYQRVKISNKRS